MVEMNVCCKAKRHELPLFTRSEIDTRATYRTKDGRFSLSFLARLLSQATETSHQYMTMAATATFDVTLVIYDLSRGMARNLSAQFLGPQFALEIIPHTGLVVYGREYFFGSGIQSEDPLGFRRSTGMYPIQSESLGRTSLTRAQFENWCFQVMQSGLYSATSYDLLRRNCNNFSHDAALQGLGLQKGVPQWILDVPQRFLSSPMGQLVRPMLQNMQLTTVSGAETVAPQAVPMRRTPTTSSNGTQSNPWADRPTSKRSDGKVLTPLLDTFTKPLTSNDTGMVDLCVTKLSSFVDHDEDRQSILNAADYWRTGRAMKVALSQRVGLIFLKFLQAGKAAIWVLMLLRLAVLGSDISHFQECLDWLAQELYLSTDGKLKSPALRSAAWLTLANAINLSSRSVLAAVIDVALGDLNQLDSRLEVRQAVSSFVYNMALIESNDLLSTDLSDVLVSIICSSLEGIGLETDHTVRLRRLMAMGCILKPPGAGGVNVQAAMLMKDLGFEEMLREASTSTMKGKDAESCRKLSEELLQLLSRSNT